MSVTEGMIRVLLWRLTRVVVRTVRKVVVDRAVESSVRKYWSLPGTRSNRDFRLVVRFCAELWDTSAGNKALHQDWEEGPFPLQGFGTK